MAWNRQALVEAMVGRFGRERWNEHVKLAATTLNGVGIAGLIGAFVAPMVNPASPEPISLLLLFGAGVLLHMAAQQVLRYYRGKE